MTGNRRQSFGGIFESNCSAIAVAVSRHPGASKVYSAYRNSNALQLTESLLSGLCNTRLMKPADYVAFVDLMTQTYSILTSSLGVTDESATFAMPNLVKREATEGPEAIELDDARLVGTDTKALIAELARMQNSSKPHVGVAQTANPFGDYNSSLRITDILTSFTQTPSQTDFQ